MNKSITVAVVANIPPPYRVPVYNLLALEKDINLKVFFCSQDYISKENEGRISFDCEYMDGNYYVMKKRDFHFDISIFSRLTKFNPDVVIVCGFIPTFIISIIWSYLKKQKLIIMIDGTKTSENKLSFFHSLLRKLVFRKISAVVGPSSGSRDLFLSYGIKSKQIFTSCLCVDNDVFSSSDKICDRPIDFLFSARLESFKRPEFAIDVAVLVSKKLNRKVSIDFLGRGQMLADLKVYAVKFSDFVNVRFHGYVGQNELPFYYSLCKIFLFPTEDDTWGVVVNEACASGLAVISTPFAGVSGDLVRDGFNGYVLDHDLNIWADKAANLLTDDSLLSNFSSESKRIVKFYNYESACSGMVDAIKYSFVD